MKRKYVILITLVIFLSGCLKPTYPTGGRVEESTPPVKATLTPNIASSVTPTAESNLNVDEFQPLFRDEFNQNLEPGWEWINEDATTWSLKKTPGKLQIIAQNSYIQLGTAKNLLIRSVPKDNYIIETSLDFSPNESDQMAGMVLYGNNQEFVLAGMGYCIPEVGCVRQGFYIDIYQKGKLKLPRNSVPVSQMSIVIRMEVQNQKLRVIASLDGRIWFRALETQLNFTPEAAGIFAGQNNGVNLNQAEFKYFTIGLLNQ